MQISQEDERTTPERRDTEIGASGGLLIAILLVATFVVILNETILSVALPRLMADLDISASSAQWLTSGFLLTMAIVIPTTGYILERFNIRPIFITAMTLFSLGTLVSALAPGFGVLLVGRVVQATGTGLMFPLLMTTVLNIVPAARRGRMLGLISIVISVAPAIGPTLSGLVLEHFSWRAMFLMVLPVAIGALILGAVLVRNVTEPRPSHLDIASIVLSALGFGGLVYGLTAIGESASGHSAVPPWAPLIVGAVSLTWFVFRQRALARRDSALLDLRVFSVRAFSIAVVLLCIIMLSLFGSLILLPIYMQSVLGKSTLATGLALLPGGLAMGLFSPFVGNMFDRYGPRPLVLPGAIALSAGMWMLASLGEDSSMQLVVAGHVTLSIGIAFALTPLMTTALGSLPEHLYSHGSAVVSTAQQVAGAAGTALFVTIMATAAQTSDGTTDIASTAHGINLAFIVGGVVSLVAVAGAAWFMRMPESARATAVS